MSVQQRVISLDQLRMRDLQEVGGKNASLGELMSELSHAGIRVPGGFATTAFAFREFLSHNALSERIDRRLQGLDVEDVAALTSEAQSEPSPLRHGMETIHDQIDQYLDKLVSIGVDSGQIRFDRFFHRDGTVGDPFLEHFQAILHDLTKIDSPLLCWPPSGKGKELVHHLRDPLDLRDDRGKALFHPFVGCALE